MLNYYRDKNEGTYREGEKGPLCDPGSELLLGGREGEESCTNGAKIN